jgi:hypothetical protein
VLEGAEGTRRGRIDYEIVKQPVRKSKRACSSSTQPAAARPGDRVEDGTILREESDELEARVRAGRLREPNFQGVAAERFHCQKTCKSAVANLSRSGSMVLDPAGSVRVWDSAWVSKSQ